MIYQQDQKGRTAEECNRAEEMELMFLRMIFEELKKSVTTWE